MGRGGRGRRGVVGPAPALTLGKGGPQSFRFIARKTRRDEMNAMMMERMGMGMGMPGTQMPGMSSGTMPANWMMVPRCTYKFEKVQGGMKITCVCDDKMACSMMQNLATTLAGGMCSCCMMMNG